MRVSSPICLILSDSFAVLQASMFDCLFFDPFSTVPGIVDGDGNAQFNFSTEDGGFFEADFTITPDFIINGTTVQDNTTCRTDTTHIGRRLGEDLPEIEDFAGTYAVEIIDSNFPGEVTESTLFVTDQGVLSDVPLAL